MSGSWDEWKRAQLIQSLGFDFSPCDFALVDIDQAGPDSLFPEEEPFSSFERLAWAYNEGRRARGVLCDIKTGRPHYSWLQNNADIFIVRLLDHSDWLYVIPRNRVQTLFTAHDGLRNRSDRLPELFPSYPSLAPYAVHQERCHDMINWVVYGNTTDALLQWERPVTKPLEGMFQFLKSTHRLSFQCILMTYEWLHKWEPQLRLHHILTQPLGGDLYIQHSEKKFIIQHKANTKSTLDIESQRSSAFDMLFWHRGDNSNGHLMVLLRDGTRSKPIQYDQKGASELVQFLDQFGDDAVKAHAKAMVDVLGADPPEREVKGVTAAQQLRLFEQDGRVRMRCHDFAMTFFNYVNGDPDGIGTQLACIYLNWDQHHPFGAAIMVQHEWTPGERTTFRSSRDLPVSLRSLLAKKPSPECVILRFCSREYHQARKSGSHFPLQQLAMELPVTDQDFFLLSSPDTILPAELPGTIMLFPSELINFPTKATEIWDENRKIIAAGKQIVDHLNLQLGHTQDDRKMVGTMVKAGVVQSNFWITPANTLRHLDLVLQPSQTTSMVIQHPEVHNVSRLNSFQRSRYITNVRTVMQGSINHGSVCAGGPFSARKYGYWHESRVKKEKEKKEEEEQKKKKEQKAKRKGKRGHGEELEEKEGEELGERRRKKERN